MEWAVAASLVMKFGAKAWDAFCADGAGTAEIEAIAAALAAAGQLGNRRGRAPSVEARHLALVLAAFGRAYAQHWAGTRQLAKPSLLRRWFDAEERALGEDIEARLRTAALVPITIGERAPGVEEVADVDAMLGDPTATPYYRGLWRVFADPAMTDEGTEAPIGADGASRRAFERAFRIAYWRAFASKAGEAVRGDALALEQHRVQVIRECLAADMAEWDDRHVFGNVRRSAYRDDLVPFMPLGEMYVEPDAGVEDERGQVQEPGPVLETLRVRLEDVSAPYVTVVKADFGSGKSLSARRLVCELAEQYLDEPTTSSGDLWFPVFVRCSEDVIGETLDLEQTVRRAIKRHAEEIGISLDSDDAACGLPDHKAQRVLIVLDGLDEVVLGQRALEGLFKHLRDKTTARRRVIVMSRPGVLPERRELKDIPVLALQPFRIAADDAKHPGQIAAWLDAWNRLSQRDSPITAEAVAQRGLAELAATPILLFMIAHTWDQHATDATPSHARLYETFFAQIARGKHERDEVEHPVVYRAAKALCDQLRDRHDIGDDAQPANAMLWLLSRLAWRDRQKAWRHRMENRVRPTEEQRDDAEPLTRRDVANLVRDELRLPDDVARTVEIGVLLTLQADLTAGCDHVHFGHKSFREFLVARYWSLCLLKLARGRERDWEKHTAPLLDARLLLPGDRVFDFLTQFITETDEASDSPFAWSSTTRIAVRDWAESSFNDESQSFPGLIETGIREDRRAVLREAALAIGSHISLLDDMPGLSARDPWTVRTFFAWFWGVGETIRLIAPRAKLGAIKADMNLRGADLRGAHLDGATMRGSILANADLTGASLIGADLIGANLQDALLTGADLTDANLTRAKMIGTQFAYANLRRASLRGSILLGVNLDHANLQAADLMASIVSNSSCEYADMEEACLTAVNGRSGSEIMKFSLRGANLRRANLSDADLTQADLADANLDGITSSALTRWPPDPPG